MAITPADIQAQTFSEAKRGYDPAEVDEFLERISSEVDAMLNKIVDLKTRLTNTEDELANTKDQLAAAQAAAESAASQTVAAEPVVEEAPAPVASNSGATESQISAALIAAQKAADGILDDAHANADQIRTEATNKAREVIRKVMAQKQLELDEIDRLKSSREDFKSSYVNLVQHFMDEAKNSFPNGTDTDSYNPDIDMSVYTGDAADAVQPQESYADQTSTFAAQDNFSDDLD